MLARKTLFIVTLFLFSLLTTKAFGVKNKNFYWGASGTALCHNYENISIWVGMSYVHQNDALTELWSRAVTACNSKGGLYDVTGSAYPHQGASWNM